MKTKHLEVRLTRVESALFPAAGHGLMVAALIEDDIVGVMRVMQGSDALVHFYAHGKNPQEKLGRFDSMSDAVAAICVAYAEGQKPDAPALSVIEGGAPDVDIH